MLLKRRADFYGGKLPEAADVLLLIEVSDSSLAFDQSVKLNLYARYGVAEYWVVDVEGKRVVTYREPYAQGYVRKAEFGAPDSVMPHAFPDLKIAVEEIFVKAEFLRRSCRPRRRPGVDYAGTAARWSPCRGRK